MTKAIALDDPDPQHALALSVAGGATILQGWHAVIPPQQQYRIDSWPGYPYYPRPVYPTRVILPPPVIIQTAPDTARLEERLAELTEEVRKLRKQMKKGGDQ